MDGWLTIGTQIDDSKFDKQLSMLEKKYANKEIDIDITSSELSDAESKLNSINNELDKRIAKEKQIKTALEEENAKQYKSSSLINMYKEQLSAITDEQLKLYDAWDKQNLEVDKLTGKLEKQKNELSEIQNKIKNTNTEQIQKNINNISTGITGIVKKVARWGLAIFGVRSAYLAVRSAMNILTQDDEQLKADIDYIKTALAYTLEPVVRKIVEWAKQLLFYIGYLVKQWTGKDIFEKANKNLKKSVSTAKELKKQLAGFDEMNIMSDTSSSSGETTIPSVDLGNKEVPGWLEFLGKKGKDILGIILAIAGAITAMKLADLLNTLGLINGQLTIMQGLGIFGIILSIYNIIRDLTEIWNKFDETIEGNNTTLKDWGDVLKWIGIGLASLGLLLGGLPLVVAGVIVAIVAVIMKYWDEIKRFFTDKVFGWLDKMIENLNKTTIGKFFATFLEEIKRVIGEVINILDGLFKSIKYLFDGIILIFKGHVKEGILSILKGMLNSAITSINILIAGLNLLITPLRAILVGIGKISGQNWTMENVRIPSIPYLAKGGIINMPGRGVPIGAGLARGGEVAPEGVIPLTDSQQMALLGEAIGKYININATVPVYVGNRMVAREIKRINAEDNFAYNR